MVLEKGAVGKEPVVSLFHFKPLGAWSDIDHFCIYALQAKHDAKLSILDRAIQHVAEPVERCSVRGSEEGL